MITMISAAKLNKIAVPKNSSAENSEANAKSEKFSALLDFPASQSEKSSRHDKKSDEAKETDESPACKNNQATTSNCVRISQPKIQPALTENSQNQVAVKTDISVGEQTNLNSATKSFSEDFPLQNNDETLIEKFQKLVKTGVENGKIEILKSSESDAKKVMSNDFLAADKTDFSNNLPKLFGEVSDILKNENPAKAKSPDAFSDANFEVDLSGKSPNAEQIKLTSANENKLSFSQPETAKTKDGKALEATTDFSAIGFNKVLESVAKEQKVSGDLPSVKPHEVLEQVETQMLQIVNFDRSETDKKILKMRLHPAELGAVEVRLEKDASGKLHAHFQAETEATKQILAENLAHLRDSLQNSGWQIERLEISSSAHSSTENGNRDERSRSFEDSGNQRKSNSVSVDSSISGDSNEQSANRLLSVRI